MKTKTLEVLIGTTIHAACKKAVEAAQKDHCNIRFVFNGQEITVTPDSDPDMLAQAYTNESVRRHDEYIASPEYKRQQEDLEQKRREHENEMNAALASAPEDISLRDIKTWKECARANAGDPYGSAVMVFAERWARLMEARIIKDESLADIAEECSHLADLDGITGFMYGCAVSILAATWKHGEELRLWHNRKTQVGDEGNRANESGGVLNPAIISIRP